MVGSRGVFFAAENHACRRKRVQFPPARCVHRMALPAFPRVSPTNPTNNLRFGDRGFPCFFLGFLCGQAYRKEGINK